MFKKLFGGEKGGGGGGGSSQSKQVSASATQRTVDAIQKLAETEELLVKRRNLLEKKVAEATEKAREYTRAKNQRAALMQLKKKKMYETQLEQVDNNIARVNEQQVMLENQRTTAETVLALQQGVRANKATMQELNIEDVDKTMEEINEAQDQMQQMNDVLSQPIGAAADLDEDELAAELREMEAEELDNQLLEPAPVPTKRVPAQAHPAAAEALPEVPTTHRAAARPVAQARKKTPEELELEALEAEMAA